MRVALVSTSFRSREPFDLRAHVRSLAPALVRAGAAVEVFSASRGSGLPPYSQRRVEVLDHVSGAPFGLTTIELGDAPEADRVASGFAAFLDREQPVVCHFESLRNFGTAVIHEARKRGVATLYCARDPWPAHDRTTLVLPDLSPFELGDGEAEARALAAERLLDGLPDHGGLPDDLAVRDRLRALLHEDLTDPEALSALREARESVEVRRAEKRVALSAVDRRFASSRGLSRQLSATVGRAFTYRAPGVDPTLLPEATPLELPKSSRSWKRGGGKESPRFTFLGSTRPIEGARVLLDAFAKVRARADAPAMTLDLFLERADPARDEAVRDRASTLGARAHFTRGPIDVAAALAETDVLVLPSLWGESCPAAPRLAHAAGLPVIATRLPGLGELLPAAATVLVEPSDAEALAKALADTAGDAERLHALRDAAQTLRIDSTPPTASADGEPAEEAQPPSTRSDGPAKTIDAEAVEWMDSYAMLLDTRRREASGGPRLAHLDGVAEELAELRALSISELFARAQGGLGKLRKAFGLTESDGVLLEKVVARGGLSRDRVEQATVTESELARSLELLRTARQAMQDEEETRIRRVDDLHEVLGQYEQEALARGAEAARMAQELGASLVERDAAQERETKVTSERDELDADLTREKARAAEAERTIKSAQARFEEVAGEAEAARAALEEVEAERARLATSIEERDEAVGALRRRIEGSDRPHDDGFAADIESIEAHCVLLDRDVETLRRHDEWLGQQAERLAALFEDVLAPESKTELGAPSRDQVLERSARALDRLGAELGWRRGEMEAARTASESLRARLMGGTLTARVSSWSAGPPLALSDSDVSDREDSTGASTGEVTEPAADVEEPAAPLPRRENDEESVDETPTTNDASVPEKSENQ
ncbi:MAG: glycosyltransferase [Planctomycetota bacterium]